MAEFPEAVQKVYEQICEQFSDVVFTGSRAMGVASESSDWDFVVCDEVGSEERLGIGNYGADERVSRSNEPEFTSVRIGDVNLIIDHRGSEMLVRWAAATDYCAEREVADRDTRIAIFERFGV